MVVYSKCVRCTGRGCAFQGLPIVHSGTVMWNHIEYHLPCHHTVIDICETCHADLPGHLINRIIGYLRSMCETKVTIRDLCCIPPENLAKLIRPTSPGGHIINACINCCEYNVGKKPVYDLLFRKAVDARIVRAITPCGSRNIAALKALNLYQLCLMLPLKDNI